MNPNRGLPGPLPQGETQLWHGSPSWQGLALRAFRVRTVALYFAVMHGAIERTPGTFLVGLLYGWLFVRTGSLIPGMLAHALHNGAILALDWTHTLPGQRGSPFLVDRYGLLPPWLVWVAVACLAAGILLVPKTRLWPEDKGWKSPDEVDDESERLAA